MDFIIRPYQPGEEQYVADLHKRLYANEYAWGPGFTEYAAKIALEFAGHEKNAREELFVAVCGGALAGSIMLCQTEDPAVGQLRLFAVEKEDRRHGIGSALPDALMNQARKAGYQKIILWTADPLKAAIRHYEELGFRPVETAENTTWSINGDPVEEIKMELCL